nr:MAG TPA: hypothetical protein [Caudoviricetes sp.]
MAIFYHRRGSAAKQAAPKLPANVQQKGLCAAIMRGEF